MADEMLFWTLAFMIFVRKRNVYFVSEELVRQASFLMGKQERGGPTWSLP